MNEFYFIRHGQTDANLQGIMCGGMWDLELNSTGMKQALEASKHFKSKIKTLNSICVSDLIRAQQTAKFFAEAYDLKPQINSDLREWKIGAWERVPFESIKEEFLGTGEPPSGGETRVLFHERIARAFEKCSEAKAPTLIVAHGGVGLALQKILGTDAGRIENCVAHHVYRDSRGLWKAEIV